MKKWLLLSGFLLAFAASAQAPKECGSEQRNYEFGGKAVKLSHCFYRVDQDGQLFNREVQAGKRYVGIYDFTSDRWLLEPAHQSIVTFRKDRVLVLDHGEPFYRYYDLMTKNYTPTRISRFIGVPFADGPKHVSTAVFEIDGDPSRIGLVDHQAGLLVRILENVDQPIKINDRESIAPIYSSRTGGYIVRHALPDGSRHYMVYSDAALELSPKIDASNVYIFKVSVGRDQRAVANSFVFFEKTDEEKGLYWPILFDHKTYLERPEGFLGIRAGTPAKSTSRFHTLSDYTGEFSDGGYLSYNAGSLPEGLQERLTFLTDRSRKVVATELVAVPMIYAGQRIFSEKRVLVFDDGVELPDFKQSFKGKENLQTFIAERQRVIQDHLQAQAVASKQEREKAAMAKRQPAAAGDAKESNRPQSEAQAFIERMHKHGPDNSTYEAFSYDVAMYCRYGGPRCSAFQIRFREYEKSYNQNRGIVSTGRQGGAAASGYGQATTDRYNAAVKSAANKEKARVQAEEWKKKR